MSAFEIAVKEVAAPEEWIEFTVGDKTDCKAVMQPTGGQIAYITLHMHKARRDESQAGALLNFLDSLLEDETQVYIMDLLLDPRNDFEVEQLLSLLEYLMEEWTARPTEQSSVSSSRQTTRGTSSKPRTRTSTSSASLAITS